MRYFGADGRGLKCPRCRRKTAWLEYGGGEKLRRYRQKACSCGYTGRRIYRPVMDSGRVASK